MFKKSISLSKIFLYMKINDWLWGMAAVDALPISASGLILVLEFKKRLLTGYPAHFYLAGM
jgi:hypothetical protein